MRWFSGEKPPRHKAGSAPIQQGSLPTLSSIRELFQENSASGEANAPYLIPKNLANLSQKDLPHYVFRLIFKGNYIAPISLQKGSRILDVGSGTGRWACEMAWSFPSVQVYGLDLQESLNRSGASSELPDNYIFQAGNILKRLPFIDASFDFVHQRLLLANIPSVQWYAVLRELVRVTRPGGWLELLEGHTTVGNAGVATEIWFSWRDAAGKLSGLDFSQMSNLDLLVRQMGLSYTSHTIDLPLGAWAGELGLLVQECMLAVYDDSVARYRRLGVSEHELVTLRAQLPVEWQERCCQVSIFLVLIENKRL